VNVHWIPAGELPAGEERARFNRTAEPLGALPEDKLNCACARRLFPNNNGKDRTVRTTRSKRSMMNSFSVVLVSKFTH